MTSKRSRASGLEDLKRRAAAAPVAAQPQTRKEMDAEAKSLAAIAAGSKRAAANAQPVVLKKNSFSRVTPNVDFD